LLVFGGLIIGADPFIYRYFFAHCDFSIVRLKIVLVD
jgi:hypothetical protein